MNSVSIPYIIRSERDRIETFQWRNIDKIKRRLESPIESDMIDIFEAQRVEAIEGLAPFRTQRASSILTVDAIFDGIKWMGETIGRLANWIARAMVEGFATGALRVELEGPDFTSQDPAVRDLLETMNLRSRLITENTTKDIAELIDQALREGWDIDRVTREINRLFDSMKAWRARRIAVVNVTAGFERGQLESFQRAGVEFKQWLSERDTRVRPTHQKGTGADGQRVAVRDPFKVGKALLMHPGDPIGGEGNLQEIMGCRCTMLPANVRN